MSIDDPEIGWAPAVCSLPRTELPSRQREFDTLFAEAVTDVERLDPGRLRLTLAGGDDLAARVQDLTARETQCCSFFAFTVTRTGDQVLELEVAVPPTQVAVLDALAAGAARAARVERPAT